MGLTNKVEITQADEAITSDDWHHVDEILCPFQSPETPQEWARYSDTLRTALAQQLANSRHRSNAVRPLREALALLNDIRPDLANISRAVEDEGDRRYFGSTNDADLLSEVLQRVENFLHRTALQGVKP